MRKLLALLLIFLMASVVYGQGGYQPKARNIKTDTSNFDVNLSTDDTTVQEALDTLDNLSTGGGGASSLAIEEDDVQISSPTASIDFRDGLDITESPTGEANVVVDPDEVISTGTYISWSGHTLNVNLSTGTVTQPWDANLYNLFLSTQGGTLSGDLNLGTNGAGDRQITLYSGTSGNYGRISTPGGAFRLQVFSDSSSDINLFTTTGGGIICRAEELYFNRRIDAYPYYENRLELWLYDNPRFIALGSKNLEFQMSDAIGAKKVSFLDSNEAEVALINSDGLIQGTTIYATSQFKCPDGTVFVSTTAFGGGGGSSTFLGLTDTPDTFESGKYFRAWTSSGTWDTPSGSGDMTKAVYDTDADDIVDNSEALAGHPYTFFLDTTTADSTYLTKSSATATYQPKDADLDDLADGTLSASKVEDKFLRNYEDDSTSYKLTVSSLSVTNQTTLNTSLSGLAKLTAGVVSAITDSSTNWDTAYTHSQDNTQAHSDYLLNNEDDTTNYKLTMSSAVVTNNATVGSLSSSGQVTSNSRKLVDQYDYAIVVSTPFALGTSIGTLISPWRSYAYTISTMTFACQGGTNVVFQVEHRQKSGFSSAGTDLFTGDVTATTSGYSGGTASDFTIPADRGLYLVITSVSGAVERLEIEYKITKD